MKTQQEVNNFFQENTVHVYAIYQIVQYLKDLNLKLPNNVILHEKGIDQAYFFKWFDAKTSLNKIKYPKTVTQCKETLPFIYSINYACSLSFKYALLVESLDRLLICRDAYWKIAGEQMGLGKPWEPDWNDLNRKYFISLTCDGITLYDDFRNPQVLAFPTAEMRDAFYENFKDLIEKCKELL